jgi:serine protease Do
MKSLKKSVAGLVLGVGLAGAWFVGGNLYSDYQFAQAQDRVDATRAQIANVQDMAAVYKAVGKTVEPSVVSIDVRKTVQSDQMLRRFFRDRDGDGQPDMPQGGMPFDMPQQFQQQGTGSGVIVETDGKTAYIVTNNHVAGGATEMVVNLSDGREIKNAKLVGADPKTDVAVVKIEAEHLIPAKWGDSDTLEKGDVVMAFGSPFGYVGSMTHGIISALHRQAGIISGSYAYENFIQVDAPINPGNSGGPLVNLKGEIIGINTAIATESGGWQGIGFAIPANQAKFVYESLKSNGRVTRGWLGVEIEDVSKAPDLAQAQGYSDRNGVLVRGMLRNAPVAGKLRNGDIITGLNGEKTENSMELRNEIARMSPGTDVKMSVFRDGKPTEVTVKLGEQPEDTAQVASAQTDNRNNNGQSTAESLGLRLAPPQGDDLQRFGMEEGVKGALVTAVRQGSPAAAAGVAPGDVITKVNDKSVNSVEDAQNAFSGVDLNKGVKVEVSNRTGQRLLFMKSE